MSVLASLVAGLERAGGERLVLKRGERPHVVIGGNRRDLGATPLSSSAVEALADQVFSGDARRALQESGSASERLTGVPASAVIVAVAERTHGELRIELRRTAVEQPLLRPANNSAAIVPVASPVRDDTGPLTLDECIVRASLRGATALYIRPGTPPAVRVAGRIETLVDVPVNPSAVDELQRDGLWHLRAGGLWIRHDRERGEIQVRLFSDSSGNGLVVQLPWCSPPEARTRVPSSLRAACEAGEGLVVVASPDRRDLRSMLAGVVEWCGRHRGGFVIVLDRVGTSDVSIPGAFVSRRPVDADADMSPAIVEAGKESPDVLVVAEPRSEAEVEATIPAAGGDRLVVVGVVAPTAIGAVRSLIERVRVDRQAALYRALSASFLGGVSHRRTRRLGGGRVVLRDVLPASAEVRSLLQRGDFETLALLQRHGDAGARSLEAVLAHAVVRGYLSLRRAAALAADVRHLVALVREKSRARRTGALAGASNRSSEQPWIEVDLHGAV